jgi:hypothetical protein
VSRWKGLTVMAAVAAAALWLLAAHPATAERPGRPRAVPSGLVFTNSSCDFYGWAGFPLHPGDVVTAYDPQGVLCGRFVVVERGVYGFLHVYGDDPLTPEDEGALTGDLITLEVNGRPVSPCGPEEPIWRGDGELIRVDIGR